MAKLKTKEEILTEVARLDAALNGLNRRKQNGQWCELRRQKHRLLAKLTLRREDKARRFEAQGTVIEANAEHLVVQLMQAPEGLRERYTYRQVELCKWGYLPGAPVMLRFRFLKRLRGAVEEGRYLFPELFDRPVEHFELHSDNGCEY